MVFCSQAFEINILAISSSGGKIIVIEIIVIESNGIVLNIYAFSEITLQFIYFFILYSTIHLLFYLVLYISSTFLSCTLQFIYFFILYSTIHLLFYLVLYNSSTFLSCTLQFIYFFYLVLYNSSTFFKTKSGIHRHLFGGQHLVLVCIIDFWIEERF